MKERQGFECCNVRKRRNAEVRAVALKEGLFYSQISIMEYKAPNIGARILMGHLLRPQI